MESIILKRDRFRKARGGNARVLEIRCEKCRHFLALYQKDGPGPLKRMYVDRILSPQNLARLLKIPLKKLPQLVCEHCQRLIGIPYLYEKEKRPAFRLFVGAVTKKIARVT